MKFNDKMKSNLNHQLLSFQNEIGMFGKNPNDIPVADLIDWGFTTTEPLISIRQKCIDCCGGSAAEADLCVAFSCPLWVFRMGKNPFC